MYGDNDCVIEAVLDDIEKLAPYDNRGKVNLHNMEYFVERLQSFESQIDACGMTGDLNSRVIMSQVRRKLPEEHRIAYLKAV